jgi:hypothetical protein
MDTILYAAVGIASHQHELEACTVYYRSGTVLKYGEAVPNLTATNYLVNNF